MRISRRNPIRKAFTLVEILIVVVILGILAAIVVPQFTSASEDAQIGNVESQLQTIRNQIELFRVRNNGTPPALATLFDADDPVDANGNSTDDDLVNRDYLRTAPNNPRTGTATVVAGVAAPAAAVAAGDDGWVYDAATGNIWANGFDEANREWIP